MSSLDQVYQAIPDYQKAGRLTLDLLTVLLPVSEGVGSELLTLPLLADFSGKKGFDWLAAQPPVPAVSRAALPDHVVAARMSDSILSTDRIALTKLEARGGDWSADLLLTRFENFDGEPAPRQLWILFSMDPGQQPLDSLTLRFSGQFRDNRGNHAPLREPLPSAYTIRFTK
jgi:hypothetical protein